MPPRGNRKRPMYEGASSSSSVVSRPEAPVVSRPETSAVSLAETSSSVDVAEAPKKKTRKHGNRASKAEEKIVVYTRNLPVYYDYSFLEKKDSVESKTQKSIEGVLFTDIDQNELYVRGLHSEDMRRNDHRHPFFK